MLPGERLTATLTPIGRPQRQPLLTSAMVVWTCGRATVGRRLQAGARPLRGDRCTSNQFVAGRRTAVMATGSFGPLFDADAKRPIGLGKTRVSGRRSPFPLRAHR